MNKHLKNIQNLIKYFKIFKNILNINVIRIRIKKLKNNFSLISFKPIKI